MTTGFVPPNTTTVVLKETPFLVLWFLVVVFRLAIIVPLVTYCWYFNWVRLDDGYQRQWRRELHAPSPNAIFRFLVFLAMMIGAHCFQLWQMIHASYREHRLVMHIQSMCFIDLSNPIESPNRFESHIEFPRLARGNQVVSKLMYRLGRVLRWTYHAIISIYEAIMRVMVVLGIRSKWFDEFFTTRETIEMIIQTIQVANTSAMIHSDAANLALVATLLLNSISTLVVEKLSGRSQENCLRTRLALLLVDVCLDYSFCIAIPFGSAVYYLSEVDLATMTFKNSMYDDVWRAALYRQMAQFTVNSPSDQASAVVFHLGLWYCLMKTQSIVDRADGQALRHTKRGLLFVSFTKPVGGKLNRGPSLQASHRCNNPLLTVHEPHSEQQEDSTDESEDAHEGPHHNSIPVSRTRHFVKRLIHFIPYLHALAGVSFTCVALHSRYFAAANVVGCRAYTHEWFASTASCMVMEINCYRRQITGQASEIEQILLQMDSEWTQSLVISHCPALTMPDSVRSLHRLFSIQLYNCTVVDWPANASITDQDNPYLTDLRFYRTNFTNGMLPSGVQQLDFPTSVSNIIMIKTNLITLPPPLHQAWRNHLVLSMEQGLLREFPSTISRMTSMTCLSLTGNEITAIPNGALDQLKLNYLYMSANPLRSLPDSAPLLTKRTSIPLEYTNLQSIPLWLRDLSTENARVAYPTTYSSFYGSPICSNRITRTEIGEELDMERIEWLTARCFRDVETSLGWYQLDLVDLNHKL